MSNAPLTILQARAIKDQQVSDALFRTLAALGMYADEDGWCYPSLSRLGEYLGRMVEIGKHRSGPTGSIEMLLHKSTLLYTERSPENERS